MIFELTFSNNEMTGVRLTSSGHRMKTLNFCSTSVIPGPSVKIQSLRSLNVSSNSFVLCSCGASSSAFTVNKRYFLHTKLASKVLPCCSACHNLYALVINNDYSSQSIYHHSSDVWGVMRSNQLSHAPKSDDALFCISKESSVNYNI